MVLIKARNAPRFLLARGTRHGCTGIERRVRVRSDFRDSRVFLGRGSLSPSPGGEICVAIALFFFFQFHRRARDARIIRRGIVAINGGTMKRLRKYQAVQLLVTISSQIYYPPRSLRARMYGSRHTAQPLLSPLNRYHRHDVSNRCTLYLGIPRQGNYGRLSPYARTDYRRRESKNCRSDQQR